MLKRFAVSSMWHNKLTGITYHKPTIVVADSKEEAEGKELNYLYATFPVEHGWTGHSTNALQISIIQI